MRQAQVDVCGLQAEQEVASYSIVEALDVWCQNRILHMRDSIDSSEYIGVVCHLHEEMIYDVLKRLYSSHCPVAGTDNILNFLV